MGADDRLELRALPRSRGDGAQVLRPLRRAEALAASQQDAGMARQWMRRVRVLQQRLARQRRRRRDVVEGPSAGKVVLTVLESRAWRTTSSTTTSCTTRLPE